MSEKTRLNKCINPYRKPGEKGHVDKDLRTISRSFSKKFPNLPKDYKVCNNCKK